ncbi:MAG: Hemolysin, chromosomal, partial [Planctomycetota bacterium]
MSLRRWMIDCANLLQQQRRHRLSAASQRRFLRIGNYGSQIRSVRSRTEPLEDRILPANLVWVGDLSSHWTTQVAGDTNWSDDLLPQDGDALLFDGAAAGSLINDSLPGNSYSMTFNTGDYTVTGQGIALDNPGTDIIQIAGENLLQTPLELNASSVEVQSGVLELQGDVTGTAGLTKLGSGTLILTGPAAYSGSTLIQSGGLQVDGSFMGADPISINSTATLGGDGSIDASVSLAGLLSPGSIVTPATAIGSLSLAALDMTASATLRFQIGGAADGEFDSLTVTGNAVLNGTLTVELTNNYTPAPGTTFRVLTAGSVSGQFTNWSGLTYTNGVLLPIQTPQGLILVATPFPTG